MKIAVISTSSRPNSNTLRFSRFIQNTLTESNQHEVQLVHFEDYDIPFVGHASIDKSNLTAFQKEFIGAWEAADLIIFAMPEYNWTAPPQLTNALHQLGGPAFKHIFDNKVFAMAGVSNGRGGRQPALDATTVMNKLISFTNSYSIVSPKLYESHETPANVDENGQFSASGHEVYNRTARAFIEYTVNVAKRWID